MSKSDTQATTQDGEHAKQSVRTDLPPMFGPVADGKVEWKRLETIDYDLMGYLLSCHLIIEHYMDEYLKAQFPSLDWNIAKLTFGQRISLLSTENVGGKFDSTPAIKHLNSLRNRFSHRIDYTLVADDMLPFVHYIKSVTPDADPPHTLKAILSTFTWTCCAAFAGSVSYIARTKGRQDHDHSQSPR
ncbi:hypothetical protein [Burkholderia vietnamiensis]|uniref:hypothetical protein n=1 Tax=Burkholderia vietnamiensis TaxID=60552 RepID=UPI000AB17340|nr:hypothetical protein [Burkholderia vietnamiensis]MCA8194074.1 hypothetical protein [Burkholderia vietnamiensis]